MQWSKPPIYVSKKNMEAWKLLHNRLCDVNLR